MIVHLKKTLRAGMIAVAIAMAAGLAAGCAVSSGQNPRAEIHDADYYGSHPMSQAEMKRKWGKPLGVLQLDPDVDQWIFPLGTSPVTGYQYFLVKKGKVIYSGVWITDVSG